MKKNARICDRFSAGSTCNLRRRLLSTLIAGCFGAGEAIANPTGPQVVNGQVSFANRGNVLSITNSAGAIINWQSFSINQGEITRFIQQSANSSVLNRIVGQDPSQILGALQSNGRVFLINPNGILFGKSAQVDVNGLVASTLNISNEDFLAGKLNFKAGDKAGNLQNQGAITTPGGGQVYLIATNVENSGVITSPRGEVLLAAGHTVQLVDSANPDLHVVVSAPENQALNLGEIIARGGKTGIYGALINQRGVVSADSAVVGENGKVVFKASRDIRVDAQSKTTANSAAGGAITLKADGTTLVQGAIEAIGDQYKGGEVRILGKQVGLTDQAVVDVSGKAGGGTVLVGGDYQGKGTVPNAYLTYTGEQASIKADATGHGDGGKVVVWADHTTRSYAHISARGGAEGGNGGFVETSGKTYLDVGSAYPAVRAPKGKAGSWLLDPENIVIADAADSNIMPGPIFQPMTSGPSVLFTSTLKNYLETNGNATVDTTGGGTGSGDITVNGAVNPDMGAAGMLTLMAHNDINLNAGISATGNKLDVTLLADQDGNGAGAVNLNNTISSNGGNVTVAGNSVTFTSAGVISADTGSVGINANSAAGSINLESGSHVYTGGSSGINLKADNITLAGTLDAASAYVALNAFTPSRTVDLGTKTVGTLGLTSSELNNIYTPKLSIGDSSNTGGITVSDPISFSGGLSLQAGSGDISVNQALHATNDLSLFTAGKLTNNSAISADNNIELSAQKMALAGGTIHNSYGYVALMSNNAIDLGTMDTADAATNRLELNNAELNTVTTNMLRIINTGVGGIDVKTAIAPAHVGTAMSLISSGTITQQAGAAISGAPALSLQGGSVTLLEANPTGVVSGRAWAGNFQYRSSNLLTVSHVDGVSGISVTGSPGMDGIGLESDSFLGINQQYGNAINTNGGWLSLKTVGSVFLGDYGNNISKVAADLNRGGLGTGHFQLHNANNLEVGGPINGISGMTTNNQEIGLFTATDKTLTINQPVNAGTAEVRLKSDNLALNSTVTGGLVTINPGTSGRSITVGSATCHVGPCLSVTNLYHVAAPTVGIGEEGPTSTAASTPYTPYTPYIGSSAAGPIYVAGITSTNSNAPSDRNSLTTRIGLLSGSDVIQGGAIDVNDLGVVAGGNVNLTHSANSVTNLAGETVGGAFNFTNSKSFTVADLVGNNYGLYGIYTAGGNISLAAAGTGDIRIASYIDAGTGNVNLRAARSLASGSSAFVSGNHLTATANAGISLYTEVNSLAATNTDTAGNSDIKIENYGPLELHGVKQGGGTSGNIYVTNYGALRVAPSYEVATDTGSITLTAHSPLTVDGSVKSPTGVITLEAGASGSGSDNLTINGTVTTAGSVALKAGDTITINGMVSGNPVTKTPNGNKPSIDPCMADPTLAGCQATAAPIADAIDSTANTINTLTATVTELVAPAAGDSDTTNTGTTSPSDSDKEDETKVAAGAQDNGEKKNEGVGKLYCN